MSDMRATERLLEVIQQAVLDGNSAYWQEESPLPFLTMIDEAVTELRRRGDTLVRAADLRRIVDYASDRDTHFTDEDSRDRYIISRTRLENALGGRMR